VNLTVSTLREVSDISGEALYTAAKDVWQGR